MTVFNYFLLDLKLAFRNSKARLLVFISLFAPFMVYFLAFQNEIFGSKFFLIDVACIDIMGYFGIYSGCFIAFEGSYFDVLNTLPINKYKFFISKYLLCVVYSVYAYIIAIPSFFINPTLFYFVTSLFIYQLGIRNSIVLLISQFNSQKVDLYVADISKADGVSFYRYINLFFAFLPLAIFSNYGYREGGILLIKISLPFVFTVPFVVKYVVSVVFQKKKYKLLQSLKK